MNRNLKLCCFVVLVTFSLSCVSSKKYKSAVAEADQLKTQVAELQSQNSTLQKQVTDYHNSSQAMAAEFEKYKSECKAIQSKYDNSKAALKDEYETMEKVSERINTALMDFKNQGVEVEFKDGIVRVNMPEKLLYKSGSAQLGADGKKALGNLAVALNEYPKLKVIVVGHTDDVSVKGKADNWSLSTERANGVVRLLNDQYKVDPVRLTAAGKGKYLPIADNNTPEGRAKNRRTDIILNPDLDRIWEEAKND